MRSGSTGGINQVGNIAREVGIVYLNNFLGVITSFRTTSSEAKAEGIVIQKVSGSRSF